MARLVAALAILLAACTTVTPPPLPSRATTTRSPNAPIVAPVPGRPYDGDALLAAMRASRRPGGVPDELEMPAVAADLAAGLWTWNGNPYPVLVVGGACGPQRCTVEVSGTPVAAAGADLYVYRVDRATQRVTLEGTDLRGYPTALDPVIDRIVRDALDPALLDGLALAGAAWQLPPATGQLWAAYRSGGEEGSSGVDVLIDLAGAAVLETREP